MKKIAISASLLLAAAGVSAQDLSGFYGEVSYGMVSVKDTSTDNLGTFKPSLGRFTVGKVVASNVAIEGFITQGLSSDSKFITDVNLDVAVKSGYGLAVRPFFKATDDIEVFARIGSVRTTTEAKASLGSVSETFTQKSTNTLYGVGVAYKINEKVSATLDYTKLSKKNDADISIVALGLRYNF